MTKISTLADVAREGWQVWAHCNNEYCCRGRPLDVAALIHRFGANHTIVGDTGHYAPSSLRMWPQGLHAAFATSGHRGIPSCPQKCGPVVDDAF